MRSAAISGRFRTAALPLPDPTGNVQLMIRGNGFPDYNQVIDDAQGTSISVTGVITSTGRAKNYTSSLLFNGSAYLSVNNTDNRFQLGSADFDICFWVFPTQVPAPGSYPGLMSVRVNSGLQSWSILINGDANRVMMELVTSTGTLYLTSSSPPVINDWNFVRAVRQGTTLALSLNGTFGPPVTSSASITPLTNPLTIGLLSTGGIGGYLSGSMQDIRFITGACLGITNFQVPVAPLKGNPRPEAAPFYSSLRAYWKLDDTSTTNNFLDSIGTNHLKTLDGTSASGLVTNAKVAKGQSLSQIDGRSLYGPLATTNLVLPNADFSFGGWMTFAANGSLITFLMGRIGAADATQIQAYVIFDPAGSGGLVATASTDGTAAGRVFTPAITTLSTNYHLVVLTFNRSANKLELRARSVSGSFFKSDVAFPGALFTGVTTANFTISGAAANGVLTWTGRAGVKIADECFFADTAITDAQFDYLFNNGVGRQLTSIQIDAT